MDAKTANDILDEHAKWWRDGFDVYDAGRGVQIVCPMLDRHGDHISLYAAEDARDGGYVLTDMGATLDDLASSGCGIDPKSSCAEKLARTLRGFGLQQDCGEIYTRTGRDGLAAAINFMMQGLTTVDDLFFTVSDHVRSLFRDDVEEWLDENGVRFSPDIQICGRSGFENKFDFVIPKSGRTAPERLIRVVSNPSQASVSNSLFGWSDVREGRGASELYLFMNEEGAGRGGISSELITACRNYEVVPVAWAGGAPDDIRRALVA